MKCAVHTEVDATGYCRQCGKPLCPQCTRDVRGALFCEECLESTVFGKPPAKTTSRAGVAAVLGFMPGLGAVYNGEYGKALLHVCIFGSLMAAIHSDMDGAHGFFSLAAACFYFYMPVDAYRVAKAREAGETPADILPLTSRDGHLPMGAVMLVGLGVLLLLMNFGLFRWERLGRLWPLGLIALGGWLMAQRRRSDG